MNWTYEYPAKQAVHFPTKLAFSIAYDPVTNDRKVKLSSPKPLRISDEQVGALLQELQALIQERYLQRTMAHLLHGPCGGDYGLAAHTLEQLTKRKVSTRTLQSWMMQPGRPSSRRCPEWAVVALQEHIDRNPTDPRTWKDVADIRQSSPEGRALLHETQLRERETARFAEMKISNSEAIQKKWDACTAAGLPAQIAVLEVEMSSKLNDQRDLMGIVLSSLTSVDNFDEFKKQFLESVRQKYQLDKLIEEIARDIRERKREFANDDGTLPAGTH